MKFRKKPVIIDAIQWHPYKGMKIEGLEEFYLGGFAWAIVKTPEGEHRASAGDWIITGVKGEKYPCKPEIFEMTYEPVDE